MTGNTNKQADNFDKSSIYIISLKSDEERRGKLSCNFKETYAQMNLVYAVDGRNMTAREYFNILNSRKEDKLNFLTPSEVGCTLSHELVLTNFLESNKKFSLILEDDVIGNDDDIRDILDLTNHIEENSVLICGGQPNSPLIKKFLIGKLIAKNIHQVAFSSLPYLSRTCCYLVDRIAAKSMIESYRRKIKVADSWYDIATESNINIYFTDKLKHPDDLSFSNIEIERTTKELVRSSSFMWLKRIKKRLFAELASRVLVGIFGWRKLL